MQQALGAQDGKYLEWKARVPMVALEVWWLLIIAFWLRMLLGRVWLFNNEWFLVTTILVIAIAADQAILGNRHVRAAYVRRFSEWSARKRMKCDCYVGVCILITPVVAIYSALKAGGLNMSHG